MYFDHFIRLFVAYHNHSHNKENCPRQIGSIDLAAFCKLQLYFHDFSHLYLVHNTDYVKLVDLDTVQVGSTIAADSPDTQTY